MKFLKMSFLKTKVHLYRYFDLKIFWEFFYSEKNPNTFVKGYTSSQFNYDFLCIASY